MKKSLQEKEFIIPIDFLRNDVKVFFVDKLGNEARHGQINEIKTDNGVPTREITFSSHTDIYTIIHECSHLVDMIQELYKIEGTEIRAYLLTYFVRQIFLQKP